MILANPEDIARYRAAGWWGDLRVHDLFAQCVAAHPDRLALVDPANRAEITEGAPARLNWRDVAVRVDALAATLHDAGLRRDDVVCLQLPTTHEHIVAYLASMRLGLIATPVPFQYREHELSHILAHLGVRAFITAGRIGKHDHAAMALRLRESTPSLAHVLVFGGAPPGAIDLDRAMQAAVDPASIPDVAVGGDDVCIVLWTSGTEARPKPVPRTHNNLLMTRRLMTEAASLAEGCHLLAPRLLNTVGGLTGAILPWLDRGAKLVLHHPFKADVLLRQIVEEAIDFTSCPPAMLHELLKNEALLEGIDFSRLRHFSSGSAALPEFVVREFAERHGVTVLNFYGSSEGASLAATGHDLPDPAERARYFPRYGDNRFTWSLSLAQAVETKLIDTEGQKITEAGRPGELCFKGPAVFSGYVGEPELTAAAFDGEGFYRTGDLFEIAGPDDRYYRFVGRRKDTIVRGGMNISAEEVENLLIAHPAIREAAAVGRPDAKLGETVCAVVVPKPGAAVSLEELVAHLRDVQKVAIYKLPQHMVLLEALPRSPAGKVLKGQLRQMVAAP